MQRVSVRLRFWIEAGLGAASLVLALVTLVSPAWIELAFGIDPDGGNGALEWLIVTALLGCALVAGVVARGESRRAAVRVER